MMNLFGATLGGMRTAVMEQGASAADSISRGMQNASSAGLAGSTGATFLSHLQESTAPAEKPPEQPAGRAASESPADQRMDEVDDRRSEEARRNEEDRRSDETRRRKDRDAVKKEDDAVEGNTVEDNADEKSSRSETRKTEDQGEQRPAREEGQDRHHKNKADETAKSKDASVQQDGASGRKKSALTAEDTKDAPKTAAIEDKSAAANAAQAENGRVVVRMRGRMAGEGEESGAELKLKNEKTSSSKEGDVPAQPAVKDASSANIPNQREKILNAVKAEVAAKAEREQPGRQIADERPNEAPRRERVELDPTKWSVHGRVQREGEATTPGGNTIEARLEAMMREYAGREATDAKSKGEGRGDREGGESKSRNGNQVRANLNEINAFANTTNADATDALSASRQKEQLVQDNRRLFNELVQKSEGQRTVQRQFHGQHPHESGATRPHDLEPGSPAQPGARAHRRGDGCGPQVADGRDGSSAPGIGTPGHPGGEREYPRAGAGFHAVRHDERRRSPRR